MGQLRRKASSARPTRGEEGASRWLQVRVRGVQKVWERRLAAVAVVVRGAGQRVVEGLGWTCLMC